MRLIAATAAVAGLLSACATGAASDLMLSMRNDDSALSMRCVLLYAHWVSEETGSVPPGGTVEVALETVPRTGEVVRRNRLGRPMAVESLYCLFGEGADPARASVAIEELRGARGRLVARCRKDGRPGCRIERSA